MRVGLCAEPHPRLIVGLLAILKAGGAYVPLDPGYPAGRLAALIEDAGPALILADAAGRRAVGAHGRAVVALDEPLAPFAPGAAELESDPDVPGLRPEHLAYVIYTSGSTGAPKGVMVAHGSLVASTLARVAAYTRYERFLLLSSVAFDSSVAGIFGTLLTGGTLHLWAQPLDVEGVRAAIERNRVTSILSVPSLLQGLARGASDDGLASLQHIISAGESCPAGLIPDLLRAAPHGIVYNEYGPTEGTVWATCHRVVGAPAGAEAVPIGRPIAGALVLVLDQHGQPVPLGAVGELYIGGAGVARGYLGRPDLTAERFVPSPFGDGERLYRTGDRVRHVGDGDLLFLGRGDLQVKVRGYRIELQEIESRLGEHAAVGEVVVVVRDGPGGGRLVAYLTAPAHAGPDAELVAALRRHLADRLPEYMVPSAFMRLDALPLTPNGKVDRAALPAPDADALQRSAYEAPEGPMETALASVWAELFDLPRIGRRDHFFELGGHSLLAVTLMERLRRLGLSADVQALFEAPVLRDLAERLGGHREVEVPPSRIAPGARTIAPADLPLIELTQDDIDRIVNAVPGGAGNIQDIYALSPLQDGILFHHLLSREGDPYLSRFPVVVPGRAFLDRFLAALQQVVDRHDILRTAFVWEGMAAPAQVVLREARLSVTEIEVSAAGAAGAEELARRTDAHDHGVDLARPPLLRLAVAQEPGTGRWLVLQLFHHLIGDHSTLEVLYDEVDAILSGRGDDLPDPTPFRTLVAQARLGVAADEHERFFRDLLGDIDEPTTPFGLREVHRDGSGVREAGLMLAAPLAARLRTLARQFGVSLASLCHVAFAQVVARTSGQERAVFGTVLFGRMHAGLGADKAMGLFINTLPVRLDVNDTSVDDSVRRAHALLAGLLRHEHAPLALAQRCSKVVAPEPLFSALLNYRHRSAPVTREESGAGDASSLAQVEWLGGEERTNYPLAVSVEDYGQALGLTAQVVEPLSPERVCAIMERALEALAGALETAPASPVRRLDVIPPAERTLVIDEWNRTEAEYPGRRCIHALFEEQARRTPSALAVVDGDVEVSYAQLDRWADRLAQRLITSGVRPGACVATLLPRGASLVAAQLGILKAGAVYVPLDPEAPPSRQRWMVSDSGARAVIAEEGGAELDVETLEVGTPPADGVRSGPSIEVSGEAPAYVMYTSGSTGRPKGVVVPHRAIARLVRDGGYADFFPSDRIAWVGNPAFDISTLEVWAPLLAGATLVVVSREEILDPPSLRALLKNRQVTVLHLTSGLFRQVIDRLGDVLADLRLLLVGGDVVDPAAVARVLRSWAPGTLLHCYGPTEGTTFTTTFPVSSVDDGAPRLPIGRPIANARVYVLDGSGEPAPLGATGELHVGGAGLAHGYLGRPDLTAERFVPDPFSRAPGARMYRTGDLVRYLPDGNPAGAPLEFLGRRDHQIKVRGYRVELGEIEARLVAHPWVRDAVVVVGPGGEADRRLWAYVTTGPEAAAIDAGELAPALRRTLADELPASMVPSAFVRLDALPLTENGKVDRRSLPAPDGETVLRRQYEAPEGPVEAQLARIWEELLGVERVGRRDNFFELGGHSLLVVTLMERLRRLGLGTDIRALFATPSLAELASVLGRHREVAVPPSRLGPDTTAITPADLPLVTLTQEDIDRIVAQVPGGVASIQDIYSLSPLQEGILFHHALESRGDPYLVVGQLAFPDRKLLDRYLAAVQQVVDRHDILRTAFVWQGQTAPAQVVLRRAPLSITEIELAPGEGMAQLAARFDPRRHRIDLARAPLLRFAIAQEPGSERWLVLEVLHHLIGDHSTLEVLHEEVAALLAGRDAELAPAQPFRNLVAQARLGVSADEHERFFRDLLGDIDEPTLPFGLAEVHGDGSDVVAAGRILPASLHTRLQAQARQLGVSVASLCHVAFGQLLARTSARERVVFGTVLFGRMQAGQGADRAMGLFINTLPVRLDLDGTGLRESVRRTHGLLAELMVHEHASLALAQRSSGVGAGAPLFSALLNYRHFSPPASRREDTRSPLADVEWLGGEERITYPLGLSVDDHGDALGLSAQVARPVSAVRVCDLMERALEALVNGLERTPEMPVRRLEILPAAERALVVQACNRTDTPYRAELCIHELFEEQVRRAPAAPAVVQGGLALSYADLDRQASQLAAVLVARGVGPDARVALCADRSPSMVVGLLAILKAGGAYVPLDPSYPAERLDELMRDCDPVLVITDAAGRGALGPERSCAMSTLALDESLPVPPLDGSPGARAAGPPVQGLRPAHVAYVIYTSGSTGTPKGVEVEHRGLTNMVQAQIAVFAVGAASRVVQFASPSFDASVSEVFMALAAGAALYLPTSEERTDLRQLEQFLARHRITHATLPPALLRASSAPPRLDPLETLILAGESPGAALVRTVSSATRVVNAYGPTEATVCATTWTRPRGFAADIVPIGHPIANTRTYVLGADGEPVPVGAVGQIFIGGAGVARGYLTRPGQTAERFVPDPFSREPGARMYRTGDLARHLPDGPAAIPVDRRRPDLDLEFLGRSDHQVKVRGHRIELGEIEARLCMHPSVREAVVVALDDGEDRRLAAYVTTTCTSEAGEAQLIASLRRHLAEQLPEYMVPTAFVRLDALPLTVSGKVDRKALPVPGAEAVVRRAHEPPQGHVEQTLARLWEELLGIERVGRSDHFFELGGHSLLAVTLMERLRRLGLGTEVRALFAAPTLAELATTLGSHREVAVPPGRLGPESTAITPADLPLVTLTQEDIDRIVAQVPGGVAGIQDIYALSPLQEGILFHHALERRGDPYLVVGQLAFPDRPLLDDYLAAVQHVVD